MKTRSSLFVIVMIASLPVFAQQAFHAEPSIQGATFFDANGATVSRMPFAPARSTVGTRFLFTDWAKATVVDNSGTSFSNGLFNFDKVGQNLYMQLPDTNAVLHVSKHDVKSVTLTDGTVTYVLKKVAALDTIIFTIHWLREINIHCIVLQRPPSFRQTTRQTGLSPVEIFTMSTRMKSPTT